MRRIPVATALLAVAAAAHAIAPTFTYQGTLEDAGAPANGTYDLQFDIVNGSGVAQGPTNTFDDVAVVRGVFTVQLAFGASALNGSDRWVRIGVRPGASSGAYTVLAPDLLLGTAPYAYVAAEAVLAGGTVNNAVTSASVLDNALTASDLGPGSVGGSEVVDNALSAADLGPSSVGATEIDPTQVQARVTQFCSGGNAIRQVFADGTVDCQTPPAGGSGWSLSGNAAAAGNFVGTTNDFPLLFRANGFPAGRFEGGTSAPNVILGASANLVLADVSGAAIGGGGRRAVSGFADLNRVFDDYGTIAGGTGNEAGDGIGTTADAQYASVGGGRLNRAAGGDAVVSGGAGNRAAGIQSAVLGGNGNAATGAQSAIGGGLSNVAAATQAVVPGGSANCAGGTASFAAGSRAAVRVGVGPATGVCGTYPGSGDGNGDEGTFAWADAEAVPFVSSGPNQFNVRAQGGVGINVAPPNETIELTVQSDADDGDFASVWLKSRGAGNDGVLLSTGDAATANGAAFYIDQFNGATQARRMALNGDGSVVVRSNTTQANTGVTLPANGGSWSSLSDRRLKTAVVAVDPVDVLDRLVSVPIATWSYTAQGERVRHMGPMAQDFAAAFGLGEDDTHIATVDADGVALAAIQGLDAKLAAQRDALAGENAALRRTLEALARRIAALEGAAHRGKMPP